MFSPTHRQHLLLAFRHLDEALDEVLRQLGADAGTPLFIHARDDVDPAAREHACAGVAAAREELRAFMAHHDLRADAPRLGATHAANAVLASALVSALKLEPAHLRGYGELTPAEGAELEALSGRLRACIEALVAALPERPS